MDIDACYHTFRRNKFQIFLPLTYSFVPGLVVTECVKRYVIRSVVVACFVPILILWRIVPSPPRLRRIAVLQTSQAKYFVTRFFYLQMNRVWPSLPTSATLGFAYFTTICMLKFQGACFPSILCIVKLRQAWHDCIPSVAELTKWDEEQVDESGMEMKKIQDQDRTRIYKTN